MSFSTGFGDPAALQMLSEMMGSGGVSMHSPYTPVPKRKKTEGADEKFAKKTMTTFVPHRCNAINCKSKNKKLFSCSGCSCVYYCSKDCQKQDWKRHKIECNHLSSLGTGIKGKPYSSKRELKKYPIGCFPMYSSLEEAKADGKSGCFICGSETNLVLTDCCGLPVCNNEDEYTLGSYKRDYCIRNHNRYTNCGHHHSEGHYGDWRNCSGCIEEVWRGTNGWNSTPMLDKHIKKGAMLSSCCVNCGNRVMTGWEKHSTDSRRNICCRRCLFSRMGEGGMPPMIVETGYNWD
eukprot:TRINITY_DN11687_c0_g1_i1.p1 TRINITY_DN11687_c0_g1~~TRINITY_DN11687_c0_g1_i1.p1  ORF type:complete len:291 (-),score=40.62 TRINITY_DN11687_c0_g1_i1:162-1034(-)